MPRNKRLHFKDLNALRGIAFFPIFLFCTLYYVSYEQNGMLKELNVFVEKIAYNSIDFFFLLSSFLLTSHALREYKYLEKFSLKNFYIRRIFRIAPVLIIALIFTFIFHPWMNEKLALHEISLPKAEPFLYMLPNYFSGPSNFEFLYLAIIAAVYMFLQFYFVWGIVLKYFNRFIPHIGIGLVLFGLVVRIIHVSRGSDFVLDTMAYGVPIGVGAFLAYAMRSDLKFIQQLKEVSKNVNTIIYIIGSLFVIGGYILTIKHIGTAFIPLITSIFYGYIIIDQTFGKNSFVKLKNQKLLTHFGRISYSLIIYQSIIGFMVMIAFESLEGNLNSPYALLLIFLSAFNGAIIAANISFKIIEKPLLRIRREFKKV